MTQASVLVVEDNDLERQITADTLREEGFAVEEAAVGKRAMELLALSQFDVVLTDLMMPGMSGEELLAKVRSSYPGSQVVVLTAHGTIDSAVQAMKTGAFYYLTKPTDRETLVMTVAKAAELSNLQQENLLLKRRLEGKFEIEGIVGQDPAILEVIRLVRRVAPSNSTVLIQGESGTGKEVVAKAIHRLSPRAARQFVAINCSAIPDNLIENELFGHERGAFTGANERKIGLFESADKSTLFLDEIADLPQGMQAKILRVLQEKELRRVGGNESFRIDVRLVAASNRNLAEEVGEGRFREDLYYRVNVVTVTLPPLRDRRGDIPLLANHALAKFGHLAEGRVKDLSREAMEVLLDYTWPGNVRQLESAIERAILLCEGDTIMPRDFPQEVLSRKTPGRSGDRQRGDKFEIPPDGLNFESFERDLILQAMEKTDWVIAKAAKMLGLSYRTLQYRIDKFNLKRGEQSRPPSSSEAK
ncbi:MAG: sigma-54 dependent transcriptional regulator [Candidatus Binatus sp.]|uniref:sigma-54-dependent transcriptional regulator n=1 Tax=Candidatus Binatus sp. TaxID=2811406 RepID=UPI0027220194|nr:sigma-54 dependent transcriptional regulator [Candidatus Binatus sp.]MDO8433906.1 sigma-54 dependent transcriptional regulator [Candidatus Binatus sp.]